MKNADLPAIPVCGGAETSTHNGIGYTKNYIDSTGLTKREYFVAEAMKGLLAGQPHWGDMTFDDVSSLAIKHADAVLLKLESEQ